jgi:hypothetical protein
MASRGKACRCRLHAHRGIALAAEHQLVEGEMPDLAFGQSVSRDARRGHLRAVLAAPLVFPMGCCPRKVRFAVDSPLEGGRFEPSVPRRDNFQGCPSFDHSQFAFPTETGSFAPGTDVRIHLPPTKSLRTIGPRRPSRGRAERLNSTHCRPPSPRQRLVGSAVKRTFTPDLYT